MICRCGCGREFSPTRSWQVYATPKCRRNAFTQGHGEVVSVRQTKRGWSVTLKFERQPDLETGAFVTVMRSERISPLTLVVGKAA